MTGMLRTTLAAAAIGVLGALPVPALATAEEGGLSMTGLSTADGPVTLLVENIGTGTATLTGVAAPAGFRCADVARQLETGAHATLTCQGATLSGPSEFRLGAVIDGTAQTLRATVDPPEALLDRVSEASALLYVDVTADKTQVNAGDEITYTITVEDRGKDFTVHNVVVRSPDVRQCDKDLGDMPPGDTKTYTCKAPAPSSTFTVRVRARGYDSGGGMIAAHDNDVIVHVGPHAPAPGSGSATMPPSQSNGSLSPGVAESSTNPGAHGPILAMTGGTAVLLATSGAVLLGGGVGLWLLARRRRRAHW